MTPTHRADMPAAPTEPPAPETPMSSEPVITPDYMTPDPIDPQEGPHA